MPQVEFVVAFIGTTLARAVAAPLNSNYKKVGGFAISNIAQICVHDGW